MDEWSVVYKSAYNEDGTLFFPERLTKDVLDRMRKTMGSYLFANQYLNQVIPDDAKSFKPNWLRYYDTIPSNILTFAFIDPAIGQKDHHDYTGIVVVSVDENGNWYLRVANRYRLTPSQIIDKMFEINKQFSCIAIGVEVVAYQEALLYMLDGEMRKRDVIIPVKGITRSRVSKQTRILGLVPKFEWGRLYLSQGMLDLEEEYATFPRGSHDDILDALASIDEIAFVPEKEKEKPIERPNSPHDSNYERWIIRQYAAGNNPTDRSDNGDFD
jgi:predicted phage terminase large subunit-like protein